MTEVKSLVEKMVSSIVDEPEKVRIVEEVSDDATLYEITVAKDDVGKLIGKGGRIANSLRTIAKASGAKNGIRSFAQRYERARINEMMATTKKNKGSQPEKDAFIKKIEKLYQNYGIDISDMDEDEFERLRQSYRTKGKQLDRDLEKSEQFKDRFVDDIV